MKDNTPPNASPKTTKYRNPDDEKPVIKLEYNLTKEQKYWLEHEAHELRMKIQNEYLEGYSNNNNF